MTPITFAEAPDWLREVTRTVTGKPLSQESLQILEAWYALPGDRALQVRCPDATSRTRLQKKLAYLQRNCLLDGAEIRFRPDGFLLLPPMGSDERGEGRS